MGREEGGIGVSTCDTHAKVLVMTLVLVVPDMTDSIINMYYQRGQMSSCVSIMVAIAIYC